MDIIGLGDNVVDKYNHHRMAYPGGNALNVTVLSGRLGVNVGYLGVVGTDCFGEHVEKCLIKESVNISRLKVREGANRYAQVDLINGERTFVGGELGVSLPFILDEDDYTYLSSAQIVHTSIYSGLEEQLPRISGVAKRLSFDFSNRWTLDSLHNIIPLLSYAFLSASGHTEKDLATARKIAEKSRLKYLVITNGKHGATLYARQGSYHQPAVLVDIVDTLGAGDAFISAILEGEIKRKNIKMSMEKAAQYASNVCTHYGAFGCGIKY